MHLVPTCRYNAALVINVVLAGPEGTSLLGAKAPSNEFPLSVRGRLAASFLSGVGENVVVQLWHVGIRSRVRARTRVP